ncbi:hypothetical protein GCM10010341_67290 [Streptomyces noursei]|nr:hypothetical protein GCM10010341_67290 [Streptomyces noursei]
MPRVRQDFGRGSRVGRGRSGSGSAGGEGWFLGRWETAETLDVDGDGRQDVLDVDLVLASVTAAAHAVAVGEFVDCSLDSGADCVAGLPLRCLLLSTDAELQVA